MTQDEFNSKVLSKVPLAEAVLTALGHTFSEEFCETVYELNRGRGYTKEITFSDILCVVRSATLEHNSFAKPAIAVRRAQSLLNATDQAFFGKLRRLNPHVSESLVGQGTLRLLELFPDSIDTDVPKCFLNHDVICIDGKKLKDVAKRLVQTRGTAGKLFGGKVLAAYSVHEKVAIGLNTCLDGESNDGPLVHGLLSQLEAFHPTTPKVCLLDSQYGDLTATRRILEKGWDFVIRYHPKTKFFPDAEGKPLTGKDSKGRAYIDEIGIFGSPSNKHRLRIRRVTVKREGKADLIIITSLLDQDKYDASSMLDVYELRWTIETMFQHVTEQFNLSHFIGSTPQATIFQFSFSLMLYNTLTLVLAHLSSERNQPISTLSTVKICKAAKKELSGIFTFVEINQIETLIRTGSSKTIAARIGKLMRQAWKPTWTKAPKQNRTYPPKPKGSGSHTSVKRCIDSYNANAK